MAAWNRSCGDDSTKRWAHQSHSDSTTCKGQPAAFDARAACLSNGLALPVRVAVLRWADQVTVVSSFLGRSRSSCFNVLCKTRLLSFSFFYEFIPSVLPPNSIASAGVHCMSNVPILLFLLGAFFVIALRLYEIVALGDQHLLRCSNYKPSFDLGFCEPRRGYEKRPNRLYWCSSSLHDSI